MPNEFDPEWYRSKYPDVELLGMDPATHYATYGKLLGRPGRPEDAATITLSNPTLALSTIEPKVGSAPAPSLTQDIRVFAEEEWKRYDRREAVLAFLSRKNLPLASVVMTAHNAEDTIEAAVESVLMQSYPNLEVVICDDASTDRTWSILQSLSLRTGGSVRAFRLARNSGTYLAKNVAITAARGDFILFQDSDDYSHPHRIACSIEPLVENKSFIASRTKYARFNPETLHLIKRENDSARLGLITLCVRSRAFNEIGYFDVVRKAGDDEWFRRLRHLFGMNSVLDLGVSLYNAELRKNSLIKDMVTYNPDGSIEQSSSESRRHYVRLFTERFQNETLRRAWYVGNFPPFPLRAVEAYPEDVAALRHDTPPVIGAVCSIPGRKELFRSVVHRILPQLDQLHVYLDKYDSVPDFLHSEKIKLYRSQDYEVDLRDNAKFLAFDTLKKMYPEGFYYFTFDDDIEYPYDYVRHLLCSIDDIGRQGVVGVHGVVNVENPVSYSLDRFIYHFSADALQSPKLVNNLGTGTVAFWSQLFERIDPFAWGRGGSVDIDFAILAKRSGVPLVCVQRHQYWIKGLDLPSSDIPLFQENNAKNEQIVRKLRGEMPWGYKAICSTLSGLNPLVRESLERFLPQFSGGVQVSRFAHRLRPDPK